MNNFFQSSYEAFSESDLLHIFFKFELKSLKGAKKI